MKTVLAVLAAVLMMAGAGMAFDDCRQGPVYIDYGPADEGQGGVWKYERGDFERITTSDPENMLATERGLIGDFGAGGTWLYDGIGWKRISEGNPEQMVK
jgi:hypothetical protein